MTAAILGSRLEPQVLSSKVNSSENVFEKMFAVTKKQFKFEGLVGDGANALKLANFLSEVVTGVTSEASRKITDCGAVIKNYLSFLELPSKVSAMTGSFGALQRGTAESVAVFVTDALGAGKACFEGLELVGTRFGLLEKNVVQFFQPVSAAATFAFGAKESILKNIPAIRKNWSESSSEVSSALLKLVKNVSYAVVGALSLVATFFGAVVHSWVFGSLLTVALVASVSGRFFDGIVLPSQLT